MTEMRAVLVEWLRSELVAEQNSGFPRLKRIPETRVVRFLDHFSNLDIRYSGRLIRPQLSYRTAVWNKTGILVSSSICFESLFGVGFGHWDLLTVVNAEKSISLFTEVIVQLAMLPDRLPAGLLPIVK